MAHKHEWDQDMRTGFEEFAVCAICGCIAPKTLVVSPHNMVTDKQLSRALRIEREAMNAKRGAKR